MTAEFQNLKEVRTESCLLRVFFHANSFFTGFVFKISAEQAQLFSHRLLGFFSRVFFIVLTNFWGK